MSQCSKCRCRKVFKADDGEELWACLVDLPKPQVKGEMLYYIVNEYDSSSCFFFTSKEE